MQGLLMLAIRRGRIENASRHARERQNGKKIRTGEANVCVGVVLPRIE
jgi:hypothetical protein